MERPGSGEESGPPYQGYVATIRVAVGHSDLPLLFSRGRSEQPAWAVWGLPMSPLYCSELQLPPALGRM